MDTDGKTLVSRHEDVNAIRGSIAQRRAAKCGFNADRISTARFRTTSPLSSPAARSPCITIPPGISPTALLDSPILLPNSLTSPTTGTFALPPLDYEISTVSDHNGDSKVGSSSSRLKPDGDPDSLLGFTPFQNRGNGNDFQALVLAEPPVDFELSKKATRMSCNKESATDLKVLNSMIANGNFSNVQMCFSDVSGNQPSLKRETINGDNVGTHKTVEEHKRGFPAAATGRTSEDGYNWRKYGQKQVKGSEYPRSYYKCTHPNCMVKKKIERSHDGQITEIIYKGAHNHPKPQPIQRAQLGPGSSFDDMTVMEDGCATSVKNDSGSVWKDTASGYKDSKMCSDLRGDGLERTSSTSVLTDISDPLSTNQAKSVGTFESAGTPELSSTLASRDDDDDDQATQGSVSLGVDADEESESKRRKLDSCFVETNLASRAVREPRVVVQIESEIDILDDGYRWRKYGQKVVKGNPNPRSYYKCTSAGCLVRKHVERASHNLKYVITTYEGKHNHEVPAARNSTNVNSSGGSLNQATANAQPALALGRSISGPKAETHLQDFGPSFDRKLVFHSDYFGHNFPGNFTNDMKLGSSSIYQMKFPSVQNSMAYGSFGFNSGSIPSLVPDFQFSLPGLHSYPNLSAAGVDFSNCGNSVGGQLQGFFSGQQQLIKPKQEQKDDSHYDLGMSSIDHVNASSSSASSLYHHIRGNFPP